MSSKIKGFICAFIAAIKYGFYLPFQKSFIESGISSNVVVAFMALGAGIVFLILYLFRNRNKKIIVKEKDSKMNILIFGIVIFDVLGNLFCVYSLGYLNAGVVSLLSVLEIVTTALIATLFFKEKMSKNTFISLVIVILASVILSIDGINQFSFSIYIMFVVLAMIFFGTENNLTGVASKIDIFKIIVIKPLCVGIFALIFSLLIGDQICDIYTIIKLSVGGIITYGIAVLTYAMATKNIGVNKTTIIYSLAPIISTIASVIIFREALSITFCISFVLMIIGIYFSFVDNKNTM